MIIPLISICVIVFLFYKGYKHLELAICTEVCDIYTSAISVIEQLCAINHDLNLEWQKFVHDYSTSKNLNYEITRKYRDALKYKKKEMIELTTDLPRMQFLQSSIKSIILQRHKLSVKEVQACEVYLNTTISQLAQLIEKMIMCIESKNILNSNILLIAVEIDSFQLEANAGFYGAVEGLCSFPKSSLKNYYELCPRIKFLPSEIGLTKRKEDYQFLQEQSFREAKKMLESVQKNITEEEILVEGYGDILSHRDVYFCIAGAKKLQSERDMFASIINKLQIDNKDPMISIYGYSYQNFDHKVIEGGHEKEYCHFIRNNVDSIVFVLNEKIGEYTKIEFDEALDSFQKTGSPKIYIYAKETDSVSKPFEELKCKINEAQQFWVDYVDNEQLRLQIERDLLLRIGEISREIEDERRKVLN